MTFEEFAVRFFSEDVNLSGLRAEPRYSKCPEIAGTRLAAILDVFRLESALLNAYNRLLSPDSIEVENGVILIAEENQNICYWGVSVRDVQKFNPPVLRSENQEPYTWNEEFESLDAFFSVFCLWQILNGAWPFFGLGKRREFTRISESFHVWERLQVGGNKTGLDFWCIGKNVVAATSGKEFFIAAKDIDSWRQVASATAIEWLHDVAI